ncbi:hypothetical protein BGZ52_005235 [Haplosporangium bisporale]|nr:hypothetical protein BGZ52_005235 [Haplosporangium bisporale]KAF9199713.1 hypothetical protein BGZ59_003740 [Podila verticillata]
MKEAGLSYGEFNKLSIFHTIHEYLINLKNATVFTNNDEKIPRPFAIGYVHFTVYTLGSFQYYDEYCPCM